MTDKQAARIVAALEKLMKSAHTLKEYNSIRTIVLQLKKKQRYELLHKRKDLRERTDN
jgi:hypothetical protein